MNAPRTGTPPPTTATYAPRSARRPTLQPVTVPSVSAASVSACPRPPPRALRAAACARVGAGRGARAPARPAGPGLTGAEDPRGGLVGGGAGGREPGGGRRGLGAGRGRQLLVLSVHEVGGVARLTGA